MQDRGGEREANYHFHLEHCGRVMGGRRKEEEDGRARARSLEEGSCGDFDFAQTEKLARTRRREGGSRKNAKNDRWSGKSVEGGSFIALFKRRRINVYEESRKR